MVTVPLLGVYSMPGDEQTIALSLLAVAAINSDPSFSPYINVSLTIKITDNIATEVDTVAAICSHIADNSTALDPAVVIGPRFTNQALAVAAWSGLAQVPVISYAATAPMLADGRLYPYFFRTAANDVLTAHAFVDLFVQYGISRVALIAQDDAFGLGGVQSMSAAAAMRGITITRVYAFETTGDISASIDIALRLARADDARIFVLWSVYGFVAPVMDAAAALGLISPRHAWLATVPYAEYAGLIGVYTFGARPPPYVMDVWKRLYPESYPEEGFPVQYAATCAYDAVVAVAHAALAAVQQGWQPTRRLASNCFGGSPARLNSYPASNSIAYALRNVSINNLTGPLRWPAAAGPSDTSLPSGDRLGGQVSIWNRQWLPDGNGGITLGSTFVAQWVASSFSSAATPTISFGTLAPSNPIIVWSNGSSVGTPPPDRDVLRGRTIRVLTLLSPPFVLLSDADSSANATFFSSGSPISVVAGGVLYHGLIIDMVAELQRALGFSTIFTVSTDTYESAVQSIARGEYDAVIADLSMTLSNDPTLPVVFTVPYLSDGMRVVVRKNFLLAGSVNLFEFLQPFELSLWLTILATVAIVGAIFNVVERGHNENIKKNSTLVHGLATGTIVMMVAMIGGDAGMPPTTVAGRILVMGTSFLSLIIMATYTAQVASTFTVRVQSSLVSGFDDLRRGNIAASRIGAVAGGSTMDAFLSQAGFAPVVFPDLESLLQALSTGAVDAGVHLSVSLEYALATTHCDLQMVGQQFGQNDYAFAFSSTFPRYHVDAVTQQLLSIRKSGQFVQLYQTYIVDQCAATDTGGDVTAPLGLESVAGLWVILAIVTGVALLQVAWQKRSKAHKAIVTAQKASGKHLQSSHWTGWLGSSLGVANPILSPVSATDVDISTDRPSIIGDRGVGRIGKHLSDPSQLIVESVVAASHAFDESSPVTAWHRDSTHGSGTAVAEAAAAGPPIVLTEGVG